ncbi:hypothetical protein HanPI659440_Chr03g0097821 [Helianthus annuus]|nr:hypothetical protein HanPI659440_Chr03g0097821 [Helianthus annuus]
MGFHMWKIICYMKHKLVLLYLCAMVGQDGQQLEGFLAGMRLENRTETCGCGCVKRQPSVQGGLWANQILSLVFCTCLVDGLLSGIWKTFIINGIY